MSDPCHDDPTPEQELELARQAAEGDDFTHAMHHLAGALAHDPAWEEALELLRGLLARCHVDPLETVPLEQGRPTFFGTVALRAWVLAEQGERAEALRLLGQGRGVEADGQRLPAGSASTSGGAASSWIR